MDLNKLYYLFLIIVFAHLFYFQIKKLNIKNPDSCLNIFKSNNYIGLFVYSGLLIGKL